MRTPAGKDCPHYYGNFKRGANKQECRLVEQNPGSAPWHPNDCSACRVPDIVAANASPYLRLKLTIKAGLLGSTLGRRLLIEATCDKHQIQVDDPMVGCPQCNAERPGLDAFLNALENSEGKDE